jgi:hypothetical protein
MLLSVVFRMACLVAGGAVIALPLFLVLERRGRACWPTALGLGAVQPVGRSAYRTGEVRAIVLGRAPVSVRVAALLCLLVAGMCTFDGGVLSGWVAASRAPVSAGLELATSMMIAVLWVLSPLLIVGARRLLRRDAGLAGLGAVLTGCVALGGSVLLTAGTVRLPREAFDELEWLWLAGALDIVAVEACTVAFWIAAWDATRER